MMLAAASSRPTARTGPQIREALEDLQAPVRGLLKTYDKPFSQDRTTRR